MRAFASGRGVVGKRGILPPVVRGLEGDPYSRCIIEGPRIMTVSSGSKGG